MLHDETVTRCPECGSSNLLFDKLSGEVVCVDCGFVIVNTTADLGPEWRSFNQEKDGKRTRVGAPITLVMYDMGLSTKIGWKDGKGAYVSDLQAEALSALKRCDKMTIMNGTVRSSVRGLSEIAAICLKLGLPTNIMETASLIYRKVVKTSAMRGRSIRNTAAAAVYLACKQCGIPRMLSEIAMALNLNKKEITKCYRFLIKKLNIAPLSPDTKLYVSRFVNNFRVRGDVERVAIELLEHARTCGLIDGRGPVGLAAAATYLAATLMGYKITQREVAEVARVTEVTIRNRYKELLTNTKIYVELQTE
ncbi:MAG: TFIIB-type zinc ribbon-containing protein [Nitrososphaerota archaeon]|nr:transcription initiation factor IIB [Aigarchaeota archaeon]MDW8076898.1 TFIIB-type zinc ribbon-containing protein [Nitrososphaerota archaeon]